MEPLGRRDFLRRGALAAGGLILTGELWRPKLTAEPIITVPAFSGWYMMALDWERMEMNVFNASGQLVGTKPLSQTSVAIPAHAEALTVGESECALWARQNPLGPGG